MSASIFHKTKLALAVSGLLIGVSAAAANDEYRQTPLSLNAKMDSAAVTGIQDAIKQVSDFNEQQVTIKGKSLFLSDESISADKQVYISPDKREHLIIKQKGDNTYGSAIIDGVHYNIFNGTITPTDTPKPDTHYQDTFIAQPNDLAKQRAEQYRLEAQRRSEFFEKMRASENRFNNEVNLLNETTNDDALTPIIVNGQEIYPRLIETAEPVYSFNRLTNNEALSTDQASAMAANNTTLQAFATGGGQLDVNVDNLIHTGAVLEEFFKSGLDSIDILDAQIDASIEQSNVMLANSDLGSVKLNNHSRTLIHDYLDYTVGNSVYERLSSNTENLLYLSTDMESKYWGSYGAGVCGFAGLGQELDMRTPDVSNIAATGADRFYTANPERQSSNIQGTSRTGCLGARTFLHEIGHSIGLNHDENTESTDFTNERYAFTFNRGFQKLPVKDENDVVTEDGRFSIMAYGCGDCFYEPLFSSPDRYSFEFGISPYEVNGADAARFADTSFYLKYMPRDKQISALPLPSVETEGPFDTVVSKTYSIPAVDGAPVKTILVRNWQQNNFYAYDLPADATEFSYGTENMEIRGRAVIVAGLNNGSSLQVVPLYAFGMDQFLDREESYVSHGSSTVDHQYPSQVQFGESYEISYRLSDSQLADMRLQYDNTDSYSDWSVKVTPPFRFGMSDEGAPNPIEVTSTIESVLETGEVSLVFTMPDKLSTQTHLDYINSSDRLSPYENLSIDANIAFNFTDSFGNVAEFGMGFVYFYLTFDYDSAIGGTEINAAQDFVVFREEEQQGPVIVNFTLDSNLDDYNYEVTEGFARTGENINAILETNEVVNSDGSLSLSVQVDADAISQSQPFGDGYFISVTNRDGLPATATTLIKESDIPHFEAPTSYLAEGDTLDLDFVVSDLQPGVTYAAEMRSYRISGDYTDYIIYSDVTATLEPIDDTSARVTAQFDLNRKFGPEDVYGIGIYPVDENGNRTGIEYSYRSHAYIFTVEENEAPVITCLGSGEEVVSDTCRIEVSGTGETLINDYYVSDANTADNLSFDWAVNSDLFPTTTSGSKNQSLSITFPDDIDKDWQELSYTLTVSDGTLSTAADFIIENANYETNIAPVITCSDENCSTTVSTTGAYTFAAYNVTDEGEDDPLDYTWTSSDSPFPIEQNGDDVIIQFPSQIDESWERFTLTLSVSDEDMNGGLSTTQTFTILNSDYESGTGGGTPTPTPQPPQPPQPPQNNVTSSDSGGGAIGVISAIFLSTVVGLRRRKKK